jgi:hypothetical protein
VSAGPPPCRRRILHSPSRAAAPAGRARAVRFGGRWQAPLTGVRPSVFRHGGLAAVVRALGVSSGREVRRGPKRSPLRQRPGPPRARLVRSAWRAGSGPRSAGDAGLPVVRARRSAGDAPLPVVRAPLPVIRARRSAGDAPLPVVRARLPVVCAPLPVACAAPGAGDAAPRGRSPAFSGGPWHSVRSARPRARPFPCRRGATLRPRSPRGDAWATPPQFRVGFGGLIHG